MIVLVCGSRDAIDWQPVFAWLDLFAATHPVTKVIHGGARGIDSMADGWARQRQIPVDAYRITHETWRAQGKSAGPRRNQRMLDEGKPDVCIAFPGGRGTRDMRERSICADVPVINAGANHPIPDTIPKLD
jgi:hypothetical protein